MRSWATPLVIGAFVVMSISGILMFFHLDSRLTNMAHEWGGWVLVAGGLAHLLLNWRPFTIYLRRPLAVGIMAVCVAILGLSFVPQGSSLRDRGYDFDMVVDTMSNASVETLAELSGKSPDEVIVALQDEGLADVTTTDTVAQLAGDSRERQGALLSAALRRGRVNR